MQQKRSADAHAEPPISVSAISGETIAVLRAEELSTVSALKESLQEQHGWPCFRQRLLLHGRILKNDDRLDSPMDLPLDLQVVLLPVQEATDAEAGALVRAAEYGDVSQVLEILQIPLDPNVRDPHHSRTALQAAAKHNHVEIVRLLLRAGADPDMDQDRIGCTEAFCMDRKKRTAPCCSVENLVCF